MNRRLNEALQATAAAPSDFLGAGDSLLPRFAAAQFPAAVPELRCLGRNFPMHRLLTLMI